MLSSQQKDVGPAQEAANMDGERKYLVVHLVIKNEFLVFQDHGEKHSAYWARLVLLLCENLRTDMKVDE